MSANKALGKISRKLMQSVVAVKRVTLAKQVKLGAKAVENSVGTSPFEAVPCDHSWILALVKP